MEKKKISSRKARSVFLTTFLMAWGAQWVAGQVGFHQSYWWWLVVLVVAAWIFQPRSLDEFEIV